MIQAHHIYQAARLYDSHISRNLRSSGPGSQTLGIPCPEEMSVLQGARTLPVVWGGLQVTESLGISPRTLQRLPPPGKETSLIPAVPGTTTVLSRVCGKPSSGGSQKTPPDPFQAEQTPGDTSVRTEGPGRWATCPKTPSRLSYGRRCREPLKEPNEKDH